ncbi:flavohemoglobin [Trichoderma citrinoviride]|uniref:nitric oxide dioxygenase n=1 Tax=Trichoderma citrinoviride TaxID=58853 RepID=A0A2T4B012_9HYPO|nr:flavohemoglobin [Trichoderma citrinoviride]PTB62652.1 flavohemoglobin [Trichoderma citrinoviride]
MAALTADQIAIIKSTVPIIRDYGTTVTTTFYANMLAAHPELKNYFSLRNQQTGAQQAALANSVLAAATYIDNLGVIAGAVERIAQKHASLFILPEHYPIVGKYLIGAFEQILGDAFTPEIKEAWVIAYGLLADIFVQREKQLYAEAGWQGWRDFVIARREDEAEGVVSFYLRPADGAALPPFLPGQYVSLQIPIPELNGLFQSRQFSLSLAPHNSTEQFRITVKKDKRHAGAYTTEDLAAGKIAGLVSQRLHDQFQVGDKVQLSPPHGEFTFSAAAVLPTAPVVLLSAGVGVTPLLSILDTILSSESEASRPVIWIHGARHSGAVTYGKYIREADAKHSNLSTKIFLNNVSESDVKGQQYDYAGRVNLDTLEADGVLPLKDASAEYYICGPEEWMVQVRAGLLNKGVSLDRQHLELFHTGTI